MENASNSKPLDHNEESDGSIEEIAPTNSKLTHEPV